jgi:hypothetical protein
MMCSGPTTDLVFKKPKIETIQIFVTYVSTERWRWLIASICYASLPTLLPAEAELEYKKFSVTCLKIFVLCLNF